MKNILVLVPHWNSPICRFTIALLQKRHNVFVIDFEEKSVEKPEELHPQKIYTSIVHVPYTDDRLFNHAEEKGVYEQIKQVITQHSIDFVISAKHRYEHLLATYKEKINARTFVPRLETVDLFQDKLKTYYAFAEDIRTPRVFETEPVNQDFYIKSTKEYIKDRENQHIPESMIIERLSYPEVNVTILVKHNAVYKLFAYQVLTHDTPVPVREKITDPALVSALEDIIQKMSYRLTSTETCVHNIDFMYSKEGELVLSEINTGRLPAGLGDFAEAEEILEALLEDWPILV